MSGSVRPGSYSAILFEEFTEIALVMYTHLLGDFCGRQGGVTEQLLRMEHANMPQDFRKLGAGQFFQHARNG